MKIRVIKSRNKKSTGKIYDLGNILTGDISELGNVINARITFEQPLKIGKEYFNVFIYKNSSCGNNLTAFLVNVVPDKFGNSRHTHFDLIEII